MTDKPLISVVMPCYNPLPAFLDQAIRSIRDQLYANWELCIADDASTNSMVREVLERHAREDPRIKVTFRSENGHISRATNSALDLASGEYIALLDHDDTLAEHALYWIAAELERHPGADVIYSDNDLIDEHGMRYGPFFKPDFNIELVLGQNMVNHLCAYRRALVERIGRMRVEFEGSQDYDLLLRAVAASDPARIRHIPTILYHWRRPADATSFSQGHLDRCIRAAHAAVADFLATKNIVGQVLPAPMAPNWQRIRYPVSSPEPLVSVIVPTRNHADLLQQVTEGVLQHTDYSRLELLIVDNGSDETETLDMLASLARNPRVRVAAYPHPFNFSAINNFGVTQSAGALLVFLNNDVEIIHPDWLKEMASHAVRTDIGAVGAKLYYPNGRIQHAGVTLGIGGVAGHSFCGAPHHAIGQMGELLLTHEVSAVTGACMMVRRTTFDEIGGFDEINLPVAFNDIDFCIRLRERGYRNIWTPFAELQHHESATRGSDLEPDTHPRFMKEFAYMREKWGDKLLNDPFFNPNLSLDSVMAELASPPRLIRPWNILVDDASTGARAFGTSNTCVSHHPR